MKPGPKPKSFESFLRPAENGCIEWAGVTLRSNGRDSHRYGRFTRDGKKYLAHRYAYEAVVGSIPDAMDVLHRCDNTLCCNPKHLFLGTQADNMADMSSKGRARKTGDPKPKGEASPRAKLTDAQITDLRARRASGETVTALATVYGVHHSYISRLARGIRR